MSSMWGEAGVYLLALLVILFGWAGYEFLTSTDLARGFFEPGAGWLGWIGWAFRSVGLVIGLLIVLILPFWASKARRYDDNDESYFKALSISNSEPPSDLPAAAVSVLEDREVTVRTVRTILLEMCQSEVLRITFEVKRSRYGSKRESEYDVKWSLGSRSKLDWENTVYESMKGNEFYPYSDQFKKTVGRQLSEHLQDRRLFDGNPMSVARWVYMLWGMGTVLFAGALIGWMAVADIRWFVGVANIVYLLPIYIIGLLLSSGSVMRSSKIGPTEEGSQEISRWMAFRRHLRQMGRSARAEVQPMPYAFSSYAIALLDEPEEWMFSGVADLLLGNGQVSETIRKSDASEENDLDSVFVSWLHRWSTFGSSEVDLSELSDKESEDNHHRTVRMSSNCISCGSETKEYAKFCTQCGTPIQRQDS